MIPRCDDFEVGEFITLFLPLIFYFCRIISLKSTEQYFTDQRKSWEEHLNIGKRGK
jgi:hypothetical protein